MNAATVELTRPSEKTAPRGKVKAEGEAKFEDVLGSMKPQGESQGAESNAEGTPKKLSKRTKGEKSEPEKKDGESKLAALVDAVASRLNAALTELTKGRVKPEGKQHVEQAFAQRGKGSKQPRSPFPKLAQMARKNKDSDGAEPVKAQGTPEKSDTPELQRVLAPREPAPILTTRATPIEVRLAATVQNSRPTAAVAPTNQYVQIQPSNEGGAAQIRLDLGNGTVLDVALDVRDGIARVHLRSNGADVTNKMAQSAGELVKALLDAGVDAAEVDIEWDDPDADTPKEQRDQDDRDGDDDKPDAEKFTSFVHIVT